MSAYMFEFQCAACGNIEHSHIASDTPLCTHCDSYINTAPVLVAIDPETADV
jgi:hypothetical protein